MESEDICRKLPADGDIPFPGVGAMLGDILGAGDALATLV